MIPPAPREARWARDEPRRTLTPAQLDILTQKVLGSHRVSATHALTDGLRNANFKIEFADGSEPVVLRLYEHDPLLCQKEVDLLRLVGASVPVPEIIHAEPRGLEDIPPFVLMRFVEGISVRDLRHAAVRDALVEAGHSIGRTLARIGQFSFGKPGWISAALAVTTPLLEGKDPVPRFIDLCLASGRLRERVPLELRDRIHTLIWNWAPRLAALDSQSYLVHGDFGHRNLLVRCVDATWRVAAVLDWEFAISGSPLADIGHFLLRHERCTMDLIEPAFIQGYSEAGGRLPERWRQLAQLLDLSALCAALTQESVPEGVAGELVDLLRRTDELADSL